MWPQRMWVVLVLLGGVLAQDLELLILHTNDMHAHYEEGNRFSGRCSLSEAAQRLCYGGYARVSTIIREARAQAAAGTGPPVLVLNAGDTFQGTIYYTAYKWSMAANMTNSLHMDALSLGNHEFDDGVAGLVPFLQEVEAPVLAANLDLSDVPEMQPLLSPSTVLDVRGTKIGVIGYLTPETANLSRSERVQFADEVRAVTAEAERLSNSGVRIILALGHSGYPMDKIIAERVPDVDVVIGGHSHSFLFTGTPPDVDIPVGPYPTFVRQPSGKEVPVVQASAFTKYLGRIKVKFNSTGDIVSRKDVEGSPILLDGSIEEDPAVLRELETWKAQLDDKLMEPIGKVLTVLDSGKCRLEECNTGNLIADAFIFFRATHFRGRGWTDAPISVQNGGSIRTSIDARERNGTVTLRDAMDVCPFENYLMLLRLNGSILLKMLEHSVFEFDPTGQHNKGGFLQFSGLFVTYDVSAPPGRRVVSALARCGDCLVPTYSPVSPDQVYGVIITDFLVSGGDGFWMLQHHISAERLDMTAYDVLADYFRSFPPLYPDVVGRIKFVDSLADTSSSNQATGGRLALLLLCSSWLLRLCS